MVRRVVGVLDGSSADSLVIDAVRRILDQGSAAAEIVPFINPEIVAPRRATPVGAIAFKKEADRRRREASQDAVARSTDAARSVLGQRGDVVIHEAIHDMPLRVLGRYFHHRDLLLVGRERPGKGTGALSTDDLLALLTDGAGPTLVLTAEAAAEAADRAPIAIAYDGSDGAQRALDDFLTLGVGGSAPIEIVSLNDDRDAAHAHAQAGVALCTAKGRDATAHSGVPVVKMGFLQRIAVMFGAAPTAATAHRLLSHNGHGFLAVSRVRA